MGTNERPWYFWPLIAFVVGLLIGWLVIGWGLWPVTWTNATVQDLRPDLRQDYVRMVAESYQQTGNLELAKQRLAGWSQDDLTQLLTDTQGVLVARDPAAAASVQRLSVALGANEAAQGGAVQGQQPQPTAAPTNGGAAQQPSALRRLVTALLFILLALAAFVVLIYLFRRWRDSQLVQEPDMTPLQPRVGAPAQSQVDLAAEREKQRPLAPLSDRIETGSVTTATPSGYRADVDRADDEWTSDDNGLEPRPRTGRTVSPRPVGPAPVAPPRSSEPSEPRTPTQPAAVPSASSTAGLQLLVENTAVYQMGEPDYDEAFDINDPIDGYMGQCGLQLIEPYGRERDQAVALQVWLWDSSDPDTQTKVLMSEGAYRDTALRSQYSGEHDAMAVRPGTEFELSSHDLLLRGRVEKVSYADMEPVRGVFADLHVKMSVYRRS